MVDLYETIHAMNIRIDRKNNEMPFESIVETRPLKKQICVPRANL